MDSAPRVLELFNVHFKATWKEKRNGKATVRFNNALEIKMCPTRDEAATIGRIACSTLNRLPSPIEEETWGQVSNHTGRTT
ncbi:hypothetical protein V502_04923 [Pseudogymnoascus sp. VKM F-4520 (FW-2644)]|nr:hypothetical protein V502_04923 [Pseudogymnoascus sp. VKM F-4520 (FW-2644)]